MVHRIEVRSKTIDARAEVIRKKLESHGFAVRGASLVDVYTLDEELAPSQLAAIARMLTNPVTEEASVDAPSAPERFDWAIETGFLPGVTDNVATTVRRGIEDLNISLPEDGGVYTSQLLFVSGEMAREQAQALANSLINPLIHRVHLKSREEFAASGGMDRIVPRVRLTTKPAADIVDLLGASDEQLAVIGKQGIANPDGTRRGPLALDLTYLKAIQTYFRQKGRNPTDLELESIAQTWSEHCKHTIFHDPIDEVKEGLFRAFIRDSTNQIRKQKGKDDFCVSVFTDNSGAITFDERYLVTHKVETHNSPSALDPFGGAITGIVGVNRDAIGFGLGAKPVINQYGFCFADPRDVKPLYRGPERAQATLTPRRIMEGVIDGVRVGGNCSGIPTPQGFLFFDSRYKGKPLVFVGTAGLIPRTSAGRPSCEKEAQAGDYIVMAGGRVGQDGIHGATFSSEALDSGSPATAVQIGDPITQKRLSDAIVKEARDLKLYTSITDNGAGGLSCSVAEMARESGGCRVQLDKVPLKYPGLEPWKTWISESQERMTLAVPPEKWAAFDELMKRRGVEATIIGEFTNNGSCRVEYHGEVVMDVELEFLHDGLPVRPIRSTYTRPKHQEPDVPQLPDLTQSLHAMLARLNIAGFSFISQQYDHEVQGGSVLKPLQGRGRVNADASVTRPVLDSNRAVVLSQGLCPAYSDIDTYHMAACSIDTALRTAVAAGARLDRLALLDNFCWCSSNEPERLGQLKEAVKACSDYALAYGTPFISGKDSMFNDFKGYDAEGKPVKISVPPTLLVTAFGVMEDCRKAVSLDAKMAGDLVYVIGETRDELGASEYFAWAGESASGAAYIGNRVPRVEAAKNKAAYERLAKAVEGDLVASALAVTRGGLAVALAKKAVAGGLGLEVSLESLPGDFTREDYGLYSESQGRVVVTVAPADQKRFEEIMKGVPCAVIGKVRSDGAFLIQGREGKTRVETTVAALAEAYQSTFRGY